MAYCTYIDVEEMIGEEYSGNTQPTKIRVVEVCAEISLEIDAVLRAAGYTTPVTDSDDLLLLERYAKLGAACAAWHEGHVTDADYPRVEAWEQAYQNFLARVRRGEQGLIDQSKPVGLGTMGSVTAGRNDGFAEAAEDGGYGRWA